MRNIQEAPAVNRPHQKEVLLPNKPPIYLSFGKHGPDGVKYLPRFGEKIESTLKSSKNGRVVVFFEAADFPQHMADEVWQATENEGGPVQTFLRGVFWLRNGKEPTSNQEFHQFEEDFLNDRSFISTKLALLNNLEARYPGRTKLLVEGREEKELEKETTLEKADLTDETLLSSSYQSTLSGRFDNALAYFQMAVYGLFDNAQKREVRIVDKIKDMAELEGVLAIFGRFGSTHSRVAHFLKQQGYGVESDFDGKENDGFFHFMPYSSAVRLMLFEPERELSQIEWYQSMIADVISYRLIDLVRRSKNEQSENLIIRAASKAVKMRLSTMDDIRSFEKVIRERGFLNACFYHFQNPTLNKLILSVRYPST